jgi:hypothetical protein
MQGKSDRAGLRQIRPGCLLSLRVIIIGLLHIKLLRCVIFRKFAEVSIEVSYHLLKEDDSLRSFYVVLVLENLFLDQFDQVMTDLR